MKYIAMTFILLVVTACGGGGGGGGETLELNAQGLPGFDGTIRLESDTGLCEIDSIPNFVTVGEDGNLAKFITFFGFITFDISAVPTGATIVSATLRIEMGEVLGDNVFRPGLFGNVVMEHINMGAGLDEADMIAPSLSGELVGGDASPTFLADNATLELKTADIRDEVQRDLDDGRTRTSLRLRCEQTQVTDDDNLFDTAGFVGFEDFDGNIQPNRARLLIRYRE